jgi:pyruvate dehydrogenase E2 component (dihydrolipoamide acetyltransferase)
MASVIEFKLPALGENIEQGDLVRLMVKPGTTVSEGQAVMELETDKAVVEVPSSVSGVVKDVKVKEGDKIKVGQTIFIADSNGSSANADVPKPSEPQNASSPPAVQSAFPAQSVSMAKPAPVAEFASSAEGQGSTEESASTTIAQSAQKENRARRKRSTDALAATEFRLQELGENISQGDLVRLMIAPGAKVSEGQPIMELETDKAVVEVPSTVSGVVKEVKVKEGEKIKVGQTIFTLEVAARAAVEPVRPPSQPVEHVSGQHGARLAFQAAIRAEGKTEEQALPPDQPQQRPTQFSMPPQLVKVAGPEHREAVPAAPSTRRLAREIGVDIYEVKGTGPGGRISEDDVKAHAKTALAAAASAVAAPARAGHFVEPKLPDFTKWGKIERVSIRGVRRKTAEHLAESWNIIPHVTQHDRADITELEHLRARFAPRAEEAGGKMTVTAIALKVCAAALKVFPQFNATIDMEKEEIIYKQYIHIGVAADTDRGLLVPVIRDVDKKNIVEIAVELSQLSQKAREKKLALADMEGGTFTITNLGGIGGTAFTPIVNHPEVAILGLSRSRVEPEWIKDKDAGKFEPRLILPLSLSYDHRLIDGADAARFLRWVAEAFEQPFLLSVQG